MRLARNLTHNKQNLYRSNLFMYIKTQETQYLTNVSQAKSLAKLTPEGRAELAEFNRRFYEAQIGEPRRRLARKDLPPSNYDLFPEAWLKEIGILPEDWDYDENYPEEK